MNRLFSLTLTILLLANYSYSQDCIDFSNYTTAYVDSVSSDNVNFPPGSAFITEGDLSLIKMAGGDYQGIQGDTTLMNLWSLGLDVSASTCTNKELTFMCAYVEGLVVDGDTVYNGVFTPASYQGSTFDFQFTGQGYGSGEFVITGDFDEVILLTQTNFIWDVCLDCAAIAPPSCLDLSNYTTAYIDSAGQDNVNFPIGSTVVGNGDINLNKYDLSTVWLGLQGDSALVYIGNLDMDVSSYNCSNKRLSFSNGYSQQMIIDGDTVYSFATPASFYQGNGFTVSFDGTGLGSGDFIIEGDFDVVTLLGGTNVLWNMCIECLSGNPSTCLDFSQYDNAYMDSVTQDNVNFPVGTPIVSQGDIDIVKIDQMTFFQGVQGDSSLFYIGNLDIDVSSSNCSNKTLTFSSAYIERMLVDGDTIFNFTSTPPFYQGNGFTVTFNGSGLGSGDFTIEGDFDVVRLLGSTNFLTHVCLSCNTVSTSSCVDFTPYDNAYMDSVTQDLVNFPVGSPILTDGDIKLVKIDSFTYFQGVQGDSALFYIGNLDIDVSSANCTNKVLTFNSAYVERMLVDGDTIYNFTSTPAFYQGNGFTVTFNGSGLGSGDFTIEGDFDVVRLLGSTNILSHICLECQGTVAVPEMKVIETSEIIAYPNPTKGIVYLELNTLDDCQVQIYDMTGKWIKTIAVESDDASIDLTDQPNGLYILNIISEKGWHTSKKIIKE